MCAKQSEENQQSFEPGALIFESTPYALAVDDQSVSRVCAFCLITEDSTSAPLQRCSRCQFLRFCSRTCQVADWQAHRTECAALRRISPVRPREPVRLLARLVVRWKRERSVSPVCDKTRSSAGVACGAATRSKKKSKASETLLGVRRTIDDCVDHVDEVKADAIRGPAFLEISAMVNAFLGPAELKSVTDKDLFRLFGVMCINSVHVANDDGAIATGLYLAPSGIDHSCRPNISGVFRGRRLQLRAIRGISCARSLADLTLAYLPLHTTRARRQSQLANEYYFCCQCELCSAPPDREVITEQQPALTEYVLELSKLVTCPSSSTSDVRTAFSRLQSMLTCSSPSQALTQNKGTTKADSAKPSSISVHSDMYSDDGGKCAQYAGVLAALPDTDAAKLQAHLTAADASLVLADFEQASKHYHQTLEVLQRVYTPNHPIYAYKALRAALLLNLSLGDSRSQDDVAKLLNIVREAERATRVALGPDHPDAKNAQSLLNEALLSLMKL